MNLVHCVSYFALYVIEVKDWALVPVAKVRIPELPLTSAWPDYSVKTVKACEALSTDWHRIGTQYLFSAIESRLQIFTAVLRVLYANVTCRKFVKLSFTSGAITFLKL